MAKIEELIPFVLYFEVGLTKSELALPVTQMYAAATKKGFANDPVDRGGATMCGVILNTYSTFRKSKGIFSTTVNDLKNMPYEDWKAIIKQMFWNRWKADEINSQPLANLLVDWVWASGVNGIKIPQRVLGVVADGIVGPKTITALNSANSKQLFDTIHNERIKFVDDIVKRNPSQIKFIKGWKRRINAITYTGLQFN